MTARGVAGANRIGCLFRGHYWWYELPNNPHPRMRRCSCCGKRELWQVTR